MVRRDPGTRRRTGSGGGSAPDPGNALTPPVESVRRALRILRCFGPDRPELGVTDLSRELDMHKSTVHRLLVTLEAEGFVRLVEGGRYALGWRLFELGSAVPAWGAIRQVVLRELERLVQRTGETAHLAVLAEGEVLYIEKVESDRPLRMPSSVGRRVPLHCTALGKILLAGLEDDERWRAIYGAQLRRFTPSTITDPDAVRNEVEKVAENGYAVDREEIEEGLMCLGAPIVDERGQTCAAISISGPSSRIQPRLAEHTDAVLEVAASLSGELGPNASRLRGPG